MHLPNKPEILLVVDLAFSSSIYVFVIRLFISLCYVFQFSGSNAESMKKVYGKFCSRHNEAVNMYKELHAKDKRFQTFIRVINSLIVFWGLGCFCSNKQFTPLTRFVTTLCFALIILEKDEQQYCSSTGDSGMHITSHSAINKVPGPAAEDPAAH